MLRITLYKNCILNETYQNVISTGLKNGKSVLERYLETLSQLTNRLNTLKNGLQQMIVE